MAMLHAMEFIHFMRRKLDKIEGVAAAIDAGAEHTSRQQFLLNEVSDLRAGMKNLVAELESWNGNG